MSTKQMSKQTKQSTVSTPTASAQVSKSTTKSVPKVEVQLHVEADEVDEVEDADADDDDEVEELDEIDAEEEVEESTTEKKKSKKVEFNCESLEEALSELLRVDTDLDQQSKYRKAVFKTYQKLVTKQLKQSKKRRAHTSDTPKEATGFVKAIPVPVNFVAFHDNHLATDAEFSKTFTSFDVTKDTPRTEITKMIYFYIRSNELYGTKEDGTQDKRSIIPDAHLRQLLAIQEDESIGFNNFQSYVTRLYGAVAAVVEEPSEEEQEETVEVIVSKTKTGKKAVAVAKA